MANSKAARALKNLLGVCLSLIGVYGSFVGILNLQSSINSEGGLGLASSVILFSFTAMSMPFVPVLYSRLGSKYSLITGYTLFFFYAGANFYPSWFTLVPGSIAFGIGQILMFVNAETYCSEVAALYAHSLGETSADAIALFLGVFGASINIGNILGGLVSSSVLFNLESVNSTDDSSVCDNTNAAYVEQNYLYYVLISIYIVIAIIGITFAATLMDSLKSDSKFQSFSVFFRDNFKVMIVNLLRLSINWKMLLLFPLFVVNGVSIGFISGTFQKVFVSDCLGVEWIGFVVTAYSISGVIAGIVIGRLHRYVPEFLLVYLGVIIGGGLTLFLIFWNREPNYYAVFGFSIGWGICNGVWQSLISGIVGATFANEKNVAYSLYELGVSLGFVVTFASGLIFSTAVHLWIIFALIAYSCLSYTVLTIVMKYITIKSEQTELESPVENSSNTESVDIKQLEGTL